jgi:hypothetical protein
MSRLTTRLMHAIAAKVKPQPQVAIKRKVLVREFINDCLYHPTKGYFSKHVNIFNTGPPIDFPALPSQDAYNRLLSDLYRKQIPDNERFYQLWHTPSELFKPWYGNAVADCIMAERQGDELLIYEMGPGNGTLCRNILDRIREVSQDLYERTTYHLIDISPQLSRRTKENLLPLHGPRLRFHQCSILDFNATDKRDCFIMGFEVLDNMPHDRVVWERGTGALLQGVVNVNEGAKVGVDSRFEEVFEPVTDPLIVDYVLAVEGIAEWKSLRWSPFELLERVPVLNFANPWKAEFIPTTAFAMLRRLREQLPRHRLLLSDFSALPDTIAGWGAPVVQTRYHGESVACSTYLLEPGLFDIFFPTHFALLARLHAKIVGSGIGQVMTHAEFCRRWGDPERTRCASGYNPMLEEFGNVQFYLSPKIAV